MNMKHLLVVATFLVGVTAAAPLFGAQKPTPGQLADQQKLKERVDALESQLKEAQVKADRALIEKEYVERIQQDAKDFYDKAFNTQIIMVSIIGLFLAAVGKFGVDHIVQSKLAEATAKLREEFTREMDGGIKKLMEANSAQVKELEDGLTKRIKQADADLRIRSDFQFQFAQGISLLGDKRYLISANHFRRAVMKYKAGKERQIVKKMAGVRAILNVFLAFERNDKLNYLERAKKELTKALYDGLDEELALVGLKEQSLRALILDRQENPTTPTEPVPPTPALGIEQ